MPALIGSQAILSCMRLVQYFNLGPTKTLKRTSNQNFAPYNRKILKLQKRGGVTFRMAQSRGLFLTNWVQREIIQHGVSVH